VVVSVEQKRLRSFTQVLEQTSVFEILTRPRNMPPFDRRSAARSKTSEDLSGPPANLPAGRECDDSA
jgi:hypothetical protein